MVGTKAGHDLAFLMERHTGDCTLVHPQSLISWLCYHILLLALAGTNSWFVQTRLMLSASTIAQPIGQNCETSYEGITYCVEDGGDIHVVVIDLDNPYIRFDMIMADDVSSVSTPQRERIEDMVNRPPYEDQEVVVAINADYFGVRHGPEGFTVKNGRRLDAGAEQQNPNALWRSSLAISRLNRVSLGRKSAEELDDPRAYRERFYNAVGGGPLILSYGVVIPNTVACLLEGFPVGACRRRIQTAAGLSEDGRLLYLAVGEGRDIQGFAHLLRDYGAFTAIKLDGGGSSQLWYNGEMRHDTDRPVGNALFVSYSAMPRHDAHFSNLSGVRIVEPGEHVEIVYRIENQGYLDWEPDLGYRLRNVQGWPIFGPAYQRLASAVQGGDELESTLTFVAPYLPGVYEAEWQFVRRSEPIGSRMQVGLVVVPSGSDATGFTRFIKSRLDSALSRREFEQAWPALRETLDREIWSQVAAELRTALVDDDGRPRTAVETYIRQQWMPPLRHLAW